MRKRIVLANIAVVITLGTATLAFEFPGTTACALIEFSGLETLPNETRIPSTSAEQQAILEIQTQAQTRIDNIFGAPRAKPIVVFLNNPATIKAFNAG